MSVFAAKLARLASAEGEEDAGILRHHRAPLLLAQAAAILRAGSSASHRAQAAEKIISALSGHIVAVGGGGGSLKLIRAVYSSSFDADAADVGAAAATLAQDLDAISLMRMTTGCVGNVRLQVSDRITALLDEIRAGPEAVDESLRRLGTTLTAAQLEFFSLECLVEEARPEDPVFLQGVAFSRRQAFPCAACRRSTAS
jgi:hypothetical protein